MSSTLAVVLSYRPEASIVQNIEALLLQVSRVVVVDNESSEQSKIILATLDQTKVALIFNDENKGVAEGFNQGIRWGLEQGFEYFLLMDQDSFPKPGMVEVLLETLKAYTGKDQTVLVGPHHEDFERKMAALNNENIEPVPLLITSGSLLSKKLIEEVGLYDGRLFIDHVDHDYCLRVAKKGGFCLKINSAVLLHKFGEAQVKTVLGKSFFLQDYSAFRRYHMMRNRIVLYKRYGIFSGAWFWMDLRSALKDLAKLILFESDKAVKLRAVLRGLKDGLLWRD